MYYIHTLLTLLSFRSICHSKVTREESTKNVLETVYQWAIIGHTSRSLYRYHYITTYVRHDLIKDYISLRHYVIACFVSFDLFFTSIIFYNLTNWSLINLFNKHIILYLSLCKCRIPYCYHLIHICIDLAYQTHYLMTALTAVYKSNYHIKNIPCTLVYIQCFHPFKCMDGDDHRDACDMCIKRVILCTTCIFNWVALWEHSHRSDLYVFVQHKSTLIYPFLSIHILFLE